MRLMLLCNIQRWAKQGPPIYLLHISIQNHFSALFASTLVALPSAILPCNLSKRPILHSPALQVFIGTKTPFSQLVCTMLSCTQ